jgi:hypothetical protein
MHDFRHIQRHVQAPLSAGRVGSNALVASDSMAGIRWTCSKTRKPSCFKSCFTSEGDSNTERKVTSE